MDSGLAGLLLDWRRRCPYNQDVDYVFPSLHRKGKQPLWLSSATWKHIRPAAKRAGIQKHVRWHVFRHSYDTLLKANGDYVKTVAGIAEACGQQDHAGHIHSRLSALKRAAQQKVFEMIVPIRSHASETAAASA
jgi:integrase